MSIEALEVKATNDADQICKLFDLLYQIDRRIKSEDELSEKESVHD